MKRFGRRARDYDGEGDEVLERRRRGHPAKPDRRGWAGQLVKIPGGAFVIDCTGKTLMPGFVMSIRTAPRRNGITPQQNWAR